MFNLHEFNANGFNIPSAIFRKFHCSKVYRLRDITGYIINTIYTINNYMLYYTSIQFLRDNKPKRIYYKRKLL